MELTDPVLSDFVDRLYVKPCQFSKKEREIRSEEVEGEVIIKRYAIII